MMYHLRNLISRMSYQVILQEKNMNSAEDFMLLLVHSHIIAAAKYLLQKKIPHNIHNIPYNIRTLSQEIINK